MLKEFTFVVAGLRSTKYTSPCTTVKLILTEKEAMWNRNVGQRKRDRVESRLDV